MLGAGPVASVVNLDEGWDYTGGFPLSLYVLSDLRSLSYCLRTSFWPRITLPTSCLAVSSSVPLC